MLNERRMPSQEREFHICTLTGNEFPFIRYIGLPAPTLGDPEANTVFIPRRRAGKNSRAVSIIPVGNNLTPERNSA